MKRVRLWIVGTPCAVALLLLLVVATGGPDPVGGDFVQDVKNGVRMAGSLFGIETISDVADLVARGFSKQGVFLKPEKNTPLQKQTASMMVQIWKLIGLDGSKLGALVMNALVFVAHVIATNLGTVKKPGLDQHTDSELPKDDEPSILQSESPLDWLLNNPPKQFRDMLNHIKDGNVTDFLESDLANLEHTPVEDSGCIRLLICKIKPFIWKMQQVVQERLNANSEEEGYESQNESENIVDIIFRNVPKMREFQANGALCESQFKHCVRRF
ncbi:uncharacterized protein LOC134214525 [Armigeres subalbatus]|uniref:uncharacterized protein LOC134214525 n=1 Tax=Armigeres subalbatus TaxID=124917 RepID=UPI002ED4CE44